MTSVLHDMAVSLILLGGVILLAALLL